MKNSIETNSKGFTLIEVIVVIIIVAILGTLLVSYMSGGISRSALPVIWVKQEFDIVDTMEKITSDYHKAVADAPDFQSSHLETFKNSLTPPTGMTLTTDYINIDKDTGALTNGLDSATGLILSVRLQMGDQSVTGLFTR